MVDVNRLQLDFKQALQIMQYRKKAHGISSSREAYRHKVSLADESVVPYEA